MALLFVPPATLKMSMKIKLLTSVVSSDYNYAAGQEVDAPEERAKDLIRAGHAELLESSAGAKSAEKATSKAAAAAEKR